MLQSMGSQRVRHDLATAQQQQAQNGCKMLTLYFSEVYAKFPGGSEDKASAHNAGDLDLIPGLGSPPEKGKSTHASILTREFHGLYSSWGCKESDTTV